jgi:hypothetical protein
VRPRRSVTVTIPLAETRVGTLGVAPVRVTAAVVELRCLMNYSSRPGRLTRAQRYSAATWLMAQGQVFKGEGHRPKEPGAQEKSRDRARQSFGHPGVRYGSEPNPYRISGRCAEGSLTGPLGDLHHSPPRPRPAPRASGAPTAGGQLRLVGDLLQLGLAIARSEHSHDELRLLSSSATNVVPLPMTGLLSSHVTVSLLGTTHTTVRYGWPVVPYGRRGGHVLRVFWYDLPPRLP